MTGQSKHWVFTLNNYTEEDEQRLRDFAAGNSCKYLIFGREVGESGTKHLQGYAIFEKKTRLSSAKASINARAHLETKRGTPQQAADYCKKDGDYEEFGTRTTNQGRRSDLDELYLAIADGQTKQEIGDTFTGTYIKYKRSIDELIRERERNHRDECKVIVFYGETGTGKTRTIWENHDPDDIYVHAGDRWFDGYVGQPVAVFDDYGGSEFKLSYFLKLLDRYPWRVPIKGSFVRWNPSRIYITSNKAPEEWYANAYPEHQRALMRRLHHIVHFTEGEGPDLREIFDH
jgi:hypothetical protein